MNRQNKTFRSMFFSMIATFVVFIVACNSGESSNSESGDTIKTQDSSQLNNFGNEHPNDRIHLQDSNAANDSSVIGRTDTTRTRDSAR